MDAAALPPGTLDALEDLVVVLDTDGAVVYWNDAVAVATGHEPSYLSTADATDLVTTADAAAMERHVETTAAEGEARARIRLRTADGGSVPRELVSKRVVDERGEPTVVVVGRDISDQLSYERELEAQSAAMTASIDGMAILNEDETYRFVNQAHASAYGYDDPSALHGLTWRDGYSDAEVARFEQEVMPTLFAEGSWRGEATGTRADGSTFPQELSLSVTENDEVVCVVRDISERREMEATLRERTERLEQFANLLAHDLRNPLSVAKGYLDLLEVPASAADDKAAIATALGRMETLINDALDLTTSGEPIAASEREPVSLAAVARDAWAGIDTAAATLDIDTTLTVTASRTQLQQVLENLFRNTIEHGGAEVAVRLGDLLDDSGFFVADDGPGVQPGDRDRIFEMGVTTKADGTGYGLTSVGQLVDAHGWTIEVDESEWGGARFEIRVPRE
jgi:PAS domain S-box-containing protein